MDDALEGRLFALRIALAAVLRADPIARASVEQLAAAGEKGLNAAEEADLMRMASCLDELGDLLAAVRGPD